MGVQWPLLVFSVLLGVTSGIFVFLAIGELTGKFKNVRFSGSLVALICLAVGGCVSVLHMGHPERAFHLLGNLGSGLSKELFAVGIMGIVSIVYVVLARKDYPGASKVTGVIGGVVGLVLSPVAGASYLIAARPTWNSFTVPLMYLGTGLALGFLLMAALVLLQRQGKVADGAADGADAADGAGAADGATGGALEAAGETSVASGAAAKDAADEAAFALKLALAGVAVMVVTVAAWVIWIAVAPYQASSRSVMRLVSGDLAALFWICVVAIGAIVPLVLAAIACRRGVAAKIVAASVQAKALGWYLLAAFACTAVGAVALRVILYAVGTSVEQFIYR